VNISKVEVFMGFSRPTGRLLFLVYADSRAAAAAVEIGCGLRDEYGLRGPLILPGTSIRHSGTSVTTSRRRRQH
jgi:hypothetical protein